VHEKTKQYIIDAVEKGYPIENVIEKLVSAGHDRNLVKRLAKEALNERIQEIEPEHDYVAEQKTTARVTAELLFSLFIRLAVGMLMFFTLSLVILQQAGHTGLHG
jgi:ribonuclease P protein component